jgi:lysophospholipase L1-like esterase
MITRILAAAVVLVAVAFGNTALEPAQRNADWTKRHEGFVARAAQGRIDLVFIGDSITDGWRKVGLPVWEKYYGAWQAVNFGIGADRTQNLLWRLPRGELDGITPRVVVLLIGTNNIGLERSGKIRNPTAEAIAGVMAVVGLIRAKLPSSRLLLLGIFPRGEVGAPIRAQLAEVNAALARLDDGKQVRFLDIGASFLESDGSIARAVMPDLLHPSERGYEIWAKAMEPTLAALMAKR